jgi:hypothetical protein
VTRILLVLLVSLTACDPSLYADNAASSSGALVSGATCPDGGTTLTYSSFGQSFMATECTSCHGSGKSSGGIRLDTQSAVQANAALIDSVAGAGPDSVRTSMPEGGSVDTATREELSTWLACGAP